MVLYVLGFIIVFITILKHTQEVKFLLPASYGEYVLICLLILSNRLLTDFKFSTVTAGLAPLRKLARAGYLNEIPTMHDIAFIGWFSNYHIETHYLVLTYSVGLSPAIVAICFNMAFTRT